MPDPDDSAALTRHVDDWLRARADAAAADPMNRYMKIDARGDPCRLLGVPKSVRRELNREIKRAFAPSSAAAYRRHVESLWALPYREARYTAAELATFWKPRIEPSALPLYERLVREGQWWDLVDIVAGQLTNRLHLRHRALMRPVLERWIDDDDLWIRRAALLAHLKHRAETDAEMLFRHCLKRAHEKEFFIRKAIGWALRELSATDPEAVRGFLENHRDVLSGLSYREGAKRLGQPAAGRLTTVTGSPTPTTPSSITRR